MARIRQPYDERRHVPWLGRDVDPGEVVTVPDGDLASYLEAGWQPADEPTAEAHRDLYAAGKTTAEPAAPVTVPGVNEQQGV